MCNSKLRLFAILCFFVDNSIGNNICRYIRIQQSRLASFRSFVPCSRRKVRYPICWDNCASSVSRSRILKASYLAHGTGAAPSKDSIFGRAYPTWRLRARKLVVRWLMRSAPTDVEDSARIRRSEQTSCFSFAIKSKFVSPAAPRQ